MTKRADTKPSVEKSYLEAVRHKGGHLYYLGLEELIERDGIEDIVVKTGNWYASELKEIKVRKVLNQFGKIENWIAALCTNAFKLEGKLRVETDVSSGISKIYIYGRYMHANPAELETRDEFSDALGQCIKDMLRVYPSSGFSLKSRRKWRIN